MKTWHGLELPAATEGLLKTPAPPDGVGASEELVATGAAFVPPSFECVYNATFRSVWRMARRMGVPDTSVDDVVQDVFVVVYRKLPQFTGASSIKTWVLAITIGVVRNYRRSWRRKGAGSALSGAAEDAELVTDGSPDPLERLSRSEAGKLLHQLLAALDEDKATLFILVEIEELTVVEVASALGLNLATVYSRLAAARRQFDRALRRVQVRERR